MSASVTPPLDIERLRADTPGCAHTTHFNSAGSALPPRVVFDTVVRHLERELLAGGYEAAAEASGRLAAVYASAARLLGCAPQEIALVEHATRAWDMAFYSLALRPGDRILTSAVEYASNYLAFLQVARRTGARIEAIPSDPDGAVDAQALEAMLDPRVRLVAVTHVPTNSGLVNPAAAIGRVARAAGVPYLLDACQSVGQMPIDVAALGCDMLSFTSRKFVRGPRGVGVLYVRRELAERLEPPMIDLHSARWSAPDAYELAPGARRFESWESNVAARLGLGAAIDYALALGLEAIERRIRLLAERLRQRLAAVPGVTVRDIGRERCGIVTFELAGTPAERVTAALRSRNIAVSVSARESTRLDMERRALDAVVRASVHVYNTEAEIETLAEALDSLHGAA